MSQRVDPRSLPPILADKAFAAPSLFEPANLLREARRQKRVLEIAVPEICILDPDGDILRALRRGGPARLSPGWACYHTGLYEFDHGGERFGIIGCAVGASFAVLLAEQLFVSGCRLLVSMTSAGQILARGPTPYFVVIDRALRDEGTSYHYLPPAEFADADQTLVEAAALYAFARARQKPVLCLAHVTNQMAVDGGDFEKGEADGAHASLAVIAAGSRVWRERESGQY